MPDTAIHPLVEQITEQLKTLSANELRTIQDFVAYIAWKHGQAESPPVPKASAEARAIERLKDLEDLDDPTKWITVIEAGEEIDVESACERLKERGFQIEISDQNS
ncbi:hypothetical protein [Nodosilinea sp. P-1105]|uniref:hypothetical protein n=1 Tax=Nodosilinea sp. P-1105 TaxID=2546229 RepID=UPI00146A18CA|nr:hypothetical protein [Nodosilinea sp. P-1105]NMF86609.1 hypothetical protein [Nodosilinea sp. P-1105]